MTNSMALITLAIETSNPSVGPGEVAIGRRGADGSAEVLDVERLAPRGRRDDALAPTIDAVVRRAGLSPGDVDRVAVSAGPGAFTPLRIAVVTAKMIAQAVGGRCVAVPSALVAAQAMFRQSPDLASACVALSSKRETAWIAVIHQRDPVDRWAASAANGRVIDGRALAELLAAEPVGALIADEHLPDPLRRAASDAGTPICAPVLCATDCLALSWSLPGEDPQALAPIYPRQPEAVSKWRELHER